MAECNLPEAEDDAPILKLGPYVFGDILGAGDDGSVYHATHEVTQQNVAVKIMKLKEFKETDSREISRRLMAFRHPHIIQLFETIIRRPYIIEIMEIPCLVNLEFYTHKFQFGVKQARNFFQQIISAVDYCHRNKIVHRDIKLRNFLVNVNLKIKLIDFGEAAVMTDGDCLQDVCGSPEYHGPEMDLERLYIGPEEDIWSCGICLFLLLTKGIFLERYQLDLSAETLNKPEYRRFFNYSPVIGLIQSMIHLDEGQRATMEDIINHPWFQQDLPRYLFPSPWNLQDKWININAMKEVHKICKIPVEEVFTALHDNDESNEACVQYCLTMDNWNCDMFKLSPIGWAFNIGPPRRIAELYARKFAANRGVVGELFGFLNCFHGFGARMDEDIVVGHRAIANTTIKKTSMVFYRGMVIREKFFPNFTMGVIRNVLRLLRMEWKVVNDFHYIIRGRKDTSGPNVKMALQLFQTFDCMYPFTLCASSLPQSDNGSNEGSHKVMSFLELCFILFYGINEVLEAKQLQSSSFRSRRNQPHVTNIQFIS